MARSLKELGLTQAMIAREMGVARQTVNQWFAGERSPSARSVHRMATAMTSLTGKSVFPADVYNLVTAIVEDREKQISVK